ncbi:MAG TPA: MFS transporter [Vicinamibacterales bacterium]|nr:MFS transporter [Vicinamibacterales bacterium]
MLNRLGLHRRELRAWAMYDWANSAFAVTIVTAIFPVYFTSVAAAGISPAEATRRLAMATTIALAISAVLAPVLGAVADYAPVKKRLLGLFMAIGALASGALFFIQRGDWQMAALLFGIGNIGFAASLAFYDSLLPHVASEDEIDRVSTAGYAIGYLGGGLLLALNVAWILSPSTFGLPDAALASRLSFLSVALWWPLFSIPLLRQVAEPAIARTGPAQSASTLVVTAFRSLGQTLRDLRRYRNAFLLLIAYVVYSDGINTIIRMATSYGTEIGLKQSALITAILLVQFVGIPFAFLFGMLAGRIGAKASVFIALGVYSLISVMGYFMKTERDFYVLALMVAAVQGGSQALSRSLFASMIPRDRSSEFFGFFSVFEKFGAIAGPAVFGLTSAMTGSSRGAILSVIIFFVIGAVLLALVDVKAGQQSAAL